MKNKTAFLLSAAFLSAAVSCTRSELAATGPETGNPARLSAKIINTPSQSDSGTILLRFDSAPDAGTVSAVMSQGFIEVRPVFTSVPGKEELEKRFNFDKWYEAVLPEGMPLEVAAEKLAGLSRVACVEYPKHLSKASDCISYPYRGSARPQTKASGLSFNDPYLDQQWGYVNLGKPSLAKDSYAGGDINVKDVWSELTTGDQSIIVAVIDEGVKYTHPDLAANMWSSKADGSHGHNFITDGPITWGREGDTGHGTHIAGTIAAVNNNNLGVSGVAGGSGNGDGVQIMSCQVFDGNTGGTITQFVQAIKYAADNGASVISCSFGYQGGAYMSDKEYVEGNRGFNALEADAVRYFEATKNNDVLDGGIAVFASGNDSLPYAEYPGAMNDFISVSAFGPDYLPTYYTNYGPGCNIVAPGGEAYHRNSVDNWLTYGMILSTMPSESNDGEDYGYMQGTSMACPHVSGVVALALSYAHKLGKKYTVKEFKDMIVTSANDFDTRLKGTKELYNHSPIELYQFQKKMGTGSIDAWKLMMKIEGVPSKLVETGRKQWVDVSDYFGTSSVNLKYLKVEISDAAKASLGIGEDPYMEYGRLFIHPTRPGSCKVKITAVGGGTEIGGDDAIGGMEVSQEVSIIARGFASDAGGWL